jgi:hypothetical protein
VGIFSGGDNDRGHMNQVAEFLFEGEEVLQTYGLLLDFVALTNKRILFVDKTAMSRRTAVISIPYSKVEAISIEKGKLWSLSNRVEIQTKGRTYELEFLKGADVMGFYRTLARMIC